MRIFYKKNKHMMTLVVVLAMLVQMVVPGIADYAFADEAKELQYDVITDVKATDANGSELEGYVDPKALISLTYTWELGDDWDVKEGDFAIVEIPEAFNLGSANFGGELIDDEDSYGTWEVDVETRKLRLTFSGLPDERSSVSGEVTFKLNLRLEEIEVELPYTLEIPISGTESKEYKITTKPKNGSSIEKNGEIFKEVTVEDINKQTWTIDINTSLDEVSNATVTDNIDKRLKYIDGSIKVYELKVYSNGNIELGDEVNSEYNVDYNDADNELKIIFTDKINKAYRLVYDTEIKEIDTTETTFIYKNEATFNGISDYAAVIVERKPLIEKKGDPSSVFNADSITWQIKVNQSLYKLNGVKVEDTIPKGLSLYGVKVYLMPEKTLQSEGESEAYIYTWDSDRKTFTIKFNEEIDEEYLIEYTTTIDEDELKNNKDEIRFTNTAKVTQDGSDEGVPTGTTVTVKKGRLINKKGTPIIGYDDEKYIDWEIDVNLGELDLNTKTVLDEMGSGLKLDTTKDIEIYPLTIDKTREENNITEGTKLGLGSYTIKYGDDNAASPTDPTTKFKIEFDEDITSAYRIKYRTIITKHETGTFTNTGTVDGVIGTGQTGPGSVNPTIENYFKKDFVGIDYNTKELKWKITIDPRRNGIDNLEITDTFDDGMLMTDSQFNGVLVKKGNDELKGEGQDYTLERTEKDNKIKGFTLKFNKQVNQGIYTIEYSTTMDPDMHPEITEGSETGEKTYEYLTYKNGVKFIGQGKNGEDIEKIADPKVNNDAKTNGNKKGRLDAANKQIHWEINLNYLSKNMKKLIVNDAIIGNQKLVAGSVKVYKYTVAANGRMSNDIELTEEEKAGINIEEAQDGKSFKVTFPDEINSPYRIRYSTEFVGISQTLYENKAVTNYGDYYAKVQHPDGDKFVFKDGAINGDNTVVEWKIVVNKSQSTISEITLRDTLSEGLELIEDSFELFEGDSTAADKKITFSEYFKIIPHPKELATDPQVFDIVSLGQIDGTYTIKYKTNIIKEDILDQKLTNEVSFKGTGVEQGKRTDTKEIAATFVTGTGSGKGEVGKFKIIKFDGNDESKTLAGAKFKLTRVLGSNKKELGEIETDENGEFTSPGLKYATYILEEIEAPYGYQISSENITVIVNKKHTEKIEVVKIENYELGSIKIIKTDKANDKKLSGAVFTVKDSEGNIVGTITTGADGTGILEGLRFGSYTVIETKAPSEYVLDSTEHQIEISIDDKDEDGKVILVKELNVTNEKKPIGPGPGPDPEPPTKPEEPEKPTEPPTKPEEPEKPTEPPTKPEEPEKPTEPPTKPEEPEKPTEPPTEPEKPEKPTVVTPPENGTVEFDEDGNWKYTPNPGFKGKDKFVIRHPDGTEELIEIDVDDIPLGTVLPKTGEGSKIGYYVTGLLLVLLGVFLRRKIV